ncbi:MAG: FMN-binding protein [Lachnospiraceae bacterium]|nr:FMN-binding protein [Lachnospiraceae bacterium]
MMKKAIFLVLACALLLPVTWCGEKNYNDGTFTGQSAVYENEDGSSEGNGYGVAVVTIQDGKISDCSFETFEPDGTKKGVDYGKEGGTVANKDYYNKAQKAVAACDEYASMLVANGELKGIDAISGATINYNQFEEAVELALEEAKE